MKVLIIHNRYRQYGGEDAVVEAEASLLRSRGVEVLRLDADNEADPRVELKGSLKLALSSHWSNESYANVRKICREFLPDVAHVHNFWLRLTPSVHAACRDAGVPTVQTLHNFRLFCTNAQFQRNGQRCEDCLGKAPWRGVVRRCYQHSFLASASVMRMIMANRARGTWQDQVNAFIALSEHSRRLFIAGGIPEERIRIKPNFVEDLIPSRMLPSRCAEFLYVGRLSEEKGVSNLISGWAASRLRSPVQLMVAGDGPERARLEQQAARLGVAGDVSFLGHRSSSEVLSLFGRARAVIMPSLFHECFPRTLVEAMSAGRPVIASTVGALDELVSTEMGLQFEPHDTNGLAQAIRRLNEDSVLADRLGAASRANFLARYTPEHNFRMLLEIYEFAMGRPTNLGGLAFAGKGRVQ
jgi:glycosyltransferase involved in cell wall biosynthesis